MAAIYDTVVLFGDSITQGAWDVGGFGARLARTRFHSYDLATVTPHHNISVSPVLYHRCVCTPL